MNFGAEYNLDQVNVSFSGSTDAGETYSLTCSATTFESYRLPSNLTVTPTFVWSFGNDLLPSGATPSGTHSSDNITYTSTLWFSPLSQSHSGSYTCRLGAGRLVNTAMVTVNGNFF